MRKLLFLLLLTPFAAMAQTEPVLIEEFYKKSNGIVKTFKLNDDVSIMQVNADNDSFDIIALNAQMKVLWKTNLVGHGMSSGKFKDKIVAVAATDFSSIKRTTNNNYKGFVLDPATGKVIVEKALYTGSATNVETPSFFFTDNGDYFKMIPLQTAFANRMHVAMPGPLALFSISRAAKQLTTIAGGFFVIDYDINLDKKSTLEPALPEGKILDFNCNKTGDLFVLYAKTAATPEVLRFEAGKSQPSGKVALKLPLHQKIDVDDLASHIILVPSQANSGIAYVGLVHDNEQKETQLTLSKVNMADSKVQTVTELFNKDHIKQLEASFTPIEKKIKDPSLGKADNLDVKLMNDVSGHLVITISGRHSVASQRVPLWGEDAALINSYNPELKLEHQNLIPSRGTSMVSAPRSYMLNGEKLHIISNDDKGPKSVNALYTVLNLSTGKWEKMQWIINKQASGYDYFNGLDIIWFKNSVIIPYNAIKGITGNKREISILQSTL